MLKVFITGITGLLGTNLADKLIERGYQVTAIARDPSRYIGNRSSNLLLLKKELFDDYEECLESVDIIVHVAGVTAPNLLSYKCYHKINCEATIRLFECAKKQNVKKFIFISSANTIGFGDSNSLGKESNPIKKPFSDLFYAQSKAEAEKYLLANNQGIDVIILSPTFLIGPKDQKPSSGKIILMVWKKRIAFYPPGGKNFVSVSNVVEGIIQSFTYAKANERYLLAGENLTYKAFFEKFNKVTGQHTILIPLPKFLLLGLGRIGDILRYFNIDTSLSIFNMRALCVRNFYDNKKSILKLKLVYTPLDIAIQQAVSYFEENY